MITMHMVYFLLWQAAAGCYKVNLTGPKYVKRNEAIHVVCSSNQTPIGFSADFLVNGITYTTLRSTKNVCYSAHLRNRCPKTPVNCHCNKDGKEYGLVISASDRNSTMTVSCLMKFQDGGQVLKSDNIIVDIYDPPSLMMKEYVKCNLSTTVQIVCDSHGGSVIYDYWLHFYNGLLIKKMKGKQHGNRSTISIGSCGSRDFGEYMCRAGYMIANETFWANVTTNLEFQGPPIAFEASTTTEPTKFSLVFYSVKATMIKWSKDGIALGNFTEFESKTHRHNISIDSNKLPMVLNGYITFLTIYKRLSGVYTVLLTNDFGEYSHNFTIHVPTEKGGFSLQTFIWILICVAVFLINSTIATLTIRRRSRRSLKRSGNSGTVGIYYAAPSTSEGISQYNSTTQQNDTDATDSAASSLYIEIVDAQVQQEDSDEMSHHYIELE